MWGLISKRPGGNAVAPGRSLELTRNSVSDGFAEAIVALGVDVVEVAEVLARGGPDDDEGAAIVHGDGGIELVVGGCRVDEELIAEGAAHGVVASGVDVPASVQAGVFALPDDHEVAVRVHRDRGVSLVSLDGLVDLDFVGEGVVFAIVESDVDAARVGIGGVVEAVGRPDDGEVAVVIDGHAVVAFLLALAESAGFGDALLVGNGVVLVDAEFGA